MFGDITYESEEEKDVRAKLTRMLKECPIPDIEILSNLGLFLTSKSLSRILFLNYLYQKIIDKHGIIIDFGTRWGQNAVVFSSLRGIYEPFNRHRKIIAFDTFEGFPKISPQDGDSELMKVGVDSVTENYEDYLGDLLEAHEQCNPLSHIDKYLILKGDAIESLRKYLDFFPETIIALAYFDFDLYEPTKECLKMIRPYLIKGSVLGFDELNDHDSPGETIALREVFNLNEIRLERFRYTSRISYFVV